MDHKPQVSTPIQLVIRFLQFLVVVLLIVNACTFIDNATHSQRTKKRSPVDTERISLTGEDPDEEDLTKLLK